MKTSKLLTLISVSLSLWISGSDTVHARQADSAVDTKLTPYQAQYQATASGLTATAKRTLRMLDDGTYELSHGMDVRVLGAKLGSVKETSLFHFHDQAVIPDTYSYEQSGVSSRKENVQFNWVDSQALSNADDRQWQLPLEPGVVDKLSFQLALRLALRDSTEEDVLIPMVDGDEIEIHRFRVVGNEAVETGLGSVDTLKVQRIREPGASRQTTFWLAKDWQLLLVKFEQTGGSGSATRLLLESATIDGQRMTPRP